MPPAPSWRRCRSSAPDRPARRTRPPRCRQARSRSRRRHWGHPSPESPCGLPPWSPQPPAPSCRSRPPRRIRPFPWRHPSAPACPWTCRWTDRPFPSCRSWPGRPRRRLRKAPCPSSRRDWCGPWRRRSRCTRPLREGAPWGLSPRRRIPSGRAPRPEPPPASSARSIPQPRTSPAVPWKTLRDPSRCDRGRGTVRRAPPSSGQRQVAGLADRDSPGRLPRRSCPRFPLESLPGRPR